MEGASYEQHYPFRGARRAHPLEKDLRLRVSHGRGREKIARVRAQRTRIVDKALSQPARCVYESVSGFRLYCELPNGILVETDRIKGEVNRP